ncbi:MAG TPA: efflux RND transporter periplasmic adaptor subunit [Steroidobacteraceae bacterium]
MTDQEQSSPGEQAKNKRRNYVVMAIFGAVLVVIGIAVLIYHLAVGRYYVSTTDAYVNGDLVRLTPQISGAVTEITTDSTQAVTQGQLLVRLDSHDTDVALAQAKANLAQTVRDVVQLFAQETRDQATIAAQQAQLRLADQNLNRDRGLISAHGVAQQDLERDQEGTRSAEAALREARAAYVATHAAVADTDPQTQPRVLQAEASLRSAWLASNRTRILSPIAGYVVRRGVQLGQQVTPVSEMLAIVPLDRVWIDANFKETQLQKIRIGQPVRVTADLYGSGFQYHGTVLGLAAGTGAALAVLPAENATGNWIKIVQRLPVRIGLDPNELRNHPLFLGLSTNIKIDVHELSGASLSVRPVWPADLKTDVYAAQDAGVDAELQRIVTENLKGVSIADVPALARAVP